MKWKKEWILNLETKNEEINSKTIELERLNKKLDRINKTLEYKVQRRSALLLDQTRKMEEYAFMNSHKLRGPIASLLGLINLLDKDYLSTEEKVNVFSSFKSEVVNIDKIVRDINRVIE
jgi:signal transduction histidine kinase